MYSGTFQILMTFYFLFRPDLVKYEQLNKSNPHGNLNNAFNVAEEKLGIASLLDAEGTLKILTRTES